GNPLFHVVRVRSLARCRPYANHAETEFFVALQNGMYGPPGYTTDTFLQYVATGRSGAYINLRPYEMTDLLKASYLMGNQEQFEQFACWTMQQGIDMLDANEWWDISGAASGVFSLTYAGLDYDPQGGPWAPQSSMWEVMEDLLQYQHPNGGFVWSSLLVPPFAENDQSMQETVYATMAMKALDPWYFADEIAAAENWIWSMQLANGGFMTYPGGDENIQVNGEALWGLLFEMDPFNDGDVDGNKIHTPQDAQWTFMIYLGSLTPSYRQYHAADCAGDGDVTPADALCIWESYLHLGCTCADEIVQPPECMKRSVVSKPVHGLPGGRLTADVTQSGNTATIAIRAESMTAEVDCFGFTVRVPETWTLSGKSFDRTVQAWQRFDAEQHGRAVQVGAWTLGDTLTDGPLVTLTFETGTGLAAQGIRIGNLLDDIGGFDVVVN
nr:hypothetical protein [bacterium]